MKTISKDKQMEIYTDGSVINNGSSKAGGGWCFLVVEGNNLLYSGCGYEAPNPSMPNTSIRMELKAVIEALKYISEFGKDIEFLIYSDSAYVVNGINQKWYESWFRTGKNSLGKIPKNLDLWKELVSLLATNMKLCYVPGHKGNRWNELADSLAKQGALKARSKKR